MLWIFCALLVSAFVFEDDFSADPLADGGWVQSNWKKSEGGQGAFEWSSGDWGVGDKGLRTSQDAKFYAISKKLPEVFNNEGKSMVFQMSVKHEQKIDCGGAYWKLFPKDLDQSELEGGSEYSVMFGPDICGSGTKRVHAIFGQDGNNLLTKNEATCETDEFTHIYTLEVEPDNTYRILIDSKEKKSGSMYDDWDFEKPKMINDPSESKPRDWVDERMISDPEDKKPEDWDQPEEFEDPDAEEPEDWDEEDDGEWEAPMIPNPDYKGVWNARRIDNPDYKGEWVHPQFENPDYVEVSDVYKRGDVAYVGMEVWQVKAGTIFDNILLTDDKSYAKEVREALLDKLSGEKAAKEEFDRPEEEDEDDDDDDDDYEDIDLDKEEL